MTAFEILWRWMITHGFRPEGRTFHELLNSLSQQIQAERNEWDRQGESWKS